MTLPRSRALVSICRIALSGVLGGMTLSAMAIGPVSYYTDLSDEDRARNGRGDRGSHKPTSASPGLMFLDDEKPSIGLGIVVGPRYDGARKFGVGPMLLGSVRKGPFFLDSLRGVGVDLMTDSGTYGSLSIDYARPSLYTRDGTGGRRRDGARYGSLDRLPGSTTFTAHLAQHFPTGTTAFVEAAYAPRWGKRYSAGVAQALVDTDRLSVSVQGVVDWSDARMNRTFFGITPQQQNQSGWAAYTPGSGLSRYSLSLMAQYKVSRHWAILGFAELSRLPSRVAASPVTSRKTGIAIGSAVQYTW